MNARAHPVLIHNMSQVSIPDAAWKYLCVSEVKQALPEHCDQQVALTYELDRLREAQSPRGVDSNGNLLYAVLDDRNWFWNTILGRKLFPAHCFLDLPQSARARVDAIVRLNALTKYLMPGRRPAAIHNLVAVLYDFGAETMKDRGWAQTWPDIKLDASERKLLPVNFGDCALKEQRHWIDLFLNDAQKIYEGVKLLRTNLGINLAIRDSSIRFIKDPAQASSEGHGFYNVTLRIESTATISEVAHEFAFLLRTHLGGHADNLPKRPRANKPLNDLQDLARARLQSELGTVTQAKDWLYKQPLFESTVQPKRASLADPSLAPPAWSKALKKINRLVSGLPD